MDDEAAQSSDQQPVMAKHARRKTRKRLPSPFIVGASRSGTSLLRAMLNAHPALAIPPETHFIPDVERACAQADDPKECFVDGVLQSKNWKQFSLDEQALYERLESLDPFTVGDGIRSIFELYAAQQGKPRWGDKTPVYAAHMKLIQRLIPEARFIHIIRDGRDVSLSALPLMRRQNPDATIEHAARYWVHRVAGTRKLSSEVGHYLEVRYENIVLDTETELRRICEFAKLDWDPTVLHYYAAGTDGVRKSDEAAISSGPARTARFNQPPDTARVHRWRADMAQEDLARVEAIAGPLLLELGYSLAGEWAENDARSMTALDSMNARTSPQSLERSTAAWHSADSDMTTAQTSEASIRKCGADAEQPSGLYQPLDVHDFSFFGFEPPTSQLQAKLARLGIWSGDPELQIHEDVSYIPATARSRSTPMYAGGFVSPEGEPLAWSDLRRKGSSIIGGLPGRIDLGSRDEYDGEVIYLGWLFDHFGHFMVESLARSWCLADCPASLPVLFHAPGSKMPAGMIQHVLDWFDIPANRILVPKKATRFRRVLVPQSLHELHFRAHELFPMPYRGVAERLLADGPSGTSDQPVYVSRRLLPHDRRPLIGEWELEEVLQENGFLIARPETMTFADQVRLFNRHQDIMAVEQTALNQVLFALGHPQIHCVATLDIPLGDYFLLPQVSGAKATIINAAAECDERPLTNRQGPQLLDLSKLFDYFEQQGFLKRRIRSELARRLEHLERQYDDAVLYQELTSATRSADRLSTELERECERRAETAWPISAALSRYYRDFDVRNCERYAQHFAELVAAENDLDRLARYQVDMGRMMSSIARLCSRDIGESIRHTLANKFSVGME